MASKDNRKWTRVDDDLDTWLEDYVDRNPETESEVLREGLQVLRERDKSPVSSLRPYVLDAAVHFLLVAAVVVVAGAGTDLVADLYAFQIGAVLVAVAGGVIAAFELTHRLTTTDTPSILTGENA